MRPNLLFCAMVLAIVSRSGVALADGSDNSSATGQTIGATKVVKPGASRSDRYTLTSTLTEAARGATGTVTFTGPPTGVIAPNNTNLTNVWSGEVCTLSVGTVRCTTKVSAPSLFEQLFSPEHIRRLSER
jgi:hypothetical protein